MKRKRVAIITQADYTWHFPVWAKTIPLLAQSYDVCGIILLPGRAGPKKGIDASLWYLRTFGLRDMFILSAFALKKQLERLTLRQKSWTALAAEHGCALIRASSPNEAGTIRWMKEQEIDIAYVSCDFILKKPVLDSVRIGVINKHSSLLHGYRGLFSHFWARLEGAPTGYSFHVVDEGIDTGPVLVERRYPEKGRYAGSLLRYYIDVFHFFPHCALLAADRLCRREFVAANPSIKDSYFGLPTRADARRFKRSFSVATLSDLFYRPRIEPSVAEFESIRRAA